jgi:hypothetical protein
MTWKRKRSSDTCSGSVRPEYADRFGDTVARQKYEALLSKASRVQTLPETTSDEHGYFAAGQAIATNCDVLVAVWNGKPSKGLGGTADVVQFAQSIQRPVIHLNPESRTVKK